MQDLVCIGSKCNAVLVDGGVAADLSKSILKDNAFNALLVTNIVLPNAIAKITLTDAEISGNGIGEDASDERCERHAVALEFDASGVSRHGVLVPQGPGLEGVKLSNNCGGDFVEAPCGAAAS